MTSGTTGTPKGAPRSEPRSLSVIGGLLSKVPFRAREVTELCIPMFHALGFAHMALGLALMGLTYGPLGTVLSELFPTAVRYTGSSLSFNFAGILGASLAPYIATWLAKTYGLQYVGYYLSTAALLTLLGLLSIRETKDDDLAAAKV